jgi:hypothetical protein
MAAHQLCVAHRYDTANLQKNIQTPKVKVALCGMQLQRKSHITALKIANYGPKRYECVVKAGVTATKR